MIAVLDMILANHNLEDDILHILDRVWKYKIAQKYKIGLEFQNQNTK